MSRPRHRLLALIVLIAVLVGLLVLAGTVDPDPRENRYPGGSDLVTNYETHVGHQASVSGTVVSTDPVIIEISKGVETAHLNVENYDRPVTEGKTLGVFGTVQPEATITAQRGYTREPWEEYYMYLVSFLAGLWVLARIVTGWRLDTDTWTITPKEISSQEKRGGT